MVVFLNGVRVHKRTPKTWCMLMSLLCHHTSFPRDIRLKNIDTLLQMRALDILSGLLYSDLGTDTNISIEGTGTHMLHNVAKYYVETKPSIRAFIADLSGMTLKLYACKCTCMQLVDCNTHM